MHGWAYDILSEGELTAYNDLLVMMRDGLNDKGVQWWLTDGTLLGATRNRPPGQIRWDDDMDIGFKKEDEDAVEGVLKELRQAGKIEWELGTGDFYQVKLAGTDMRKKYYLDIFPFELRSDRGHGRAYYHFGTAYNWFPGTRYFPGEVANLTQCGFNGEHMPCPADRKTIILRQFGPEALTTAVVYGFHEQGGKKITFSLTEDVNRHMGLLPALNRELLEKLRFDS